MVPVISEKLRKRIVGRLTKKQGVSQETASRILDATLQFLEIAGKHPEERLAPSPLVDEGWHTFLMYTRDYREFCQRIMGHYINHEPNDDPDRVQTGSPEKTVCFMRSLGLQFDEALWGMQSDSGDVELLALANIMPRALSRQGSCVPSSATCDPGPPDCGVR